MGILQKYNQIKVGELSGRYITNDAVFPLLSKRFSRGVVTVCGTSVLGKPVYAYKIGDGKTRILMWSQMHGNESTTTKGIMDLLSYYHADEENLPKDITLLVVPILNPDGAAAYTRENANGVDLNRDAQDLSQPESRILRDVYDQFSPHYCFNMHDQRSIFAVGDTGMPATISFLAPSYDPDRSINDIRSKAIGLINVMNKALQEQIPGQVARFDDAFNINCVGDSFQSLGSPTILLEAGHFPNDYEREVSRQYVFIALLSAFDAIYENVIAASEIEQYLHIPQNNPIFFDFLYKNIKIDYDNSEIITNFAAQFTEELVDNVVIFKAFIVKIGDLKENRGHVEIDGHGRKYSSPFGTTPSLLHPADFRLADDMIIKNGHCYHFPGSWPKQK